MVGDDAKSIIRDYQNLWQQQANFRTLWNISAQFVMPAWDNFIGEFAEGVNRNTRIFDSTAIIANERFAAAMESILTPRSQIWHKLKAEQEELNDVPAVQQYLDQVNKILFAARYHPEANFASQTDECYMSLGAFGNNILFVDEVPGKCLRYRSLPLSEIVWAINHQGMVDTFYRCFEYSPKQAVQHWGEDKLPEGVKRAFAQNPYTDKLKFLHCVRPNYQYTEGSYGDRGKKFECWYLYLGDQSIIEQGAYRVFPAAVGRYRVAPREHYGRGPAITCLPDIRTANEMMKTTLRVGQKAADPPVLLAEESILNNFNQRPGANNYGMVTSDGKQLAVPWKTGADWQANEKIQERVLSSVRDTFLNTLFQILVNNPNMTATEALLRAQEKGELIAPAMGRQQSEFLGPCIHREIDLMSNARQFPPPPKELLKSGKGITIEYTSPLARAMRAEEGSSIMNTISDIGTAAQLDRSVVQLMDMHEAIREMAEIRGCPAKLIRSEAQVVALLEHQQEQQQMNTAAAQAPGVSQSILNLSKAAQAGGAAGGAGAPAAGAPEAAPS